MQAKPTLSSAVAEGDLNRIQQIINREHITPEATVDGQSLVHVTCLCGWKKAVILLLSKGFRANLKGLNNRTALHEAASRGDVKIIKRLLDKSAEINAEDDLGWTPLHEAAAGGKNKAVNLLLEKGADLTMKDYHGSTALHKAAASGIIGSVRCLCNKGMYVNATDGRCRTALHDAAARGHVKIIGCFLDNRADVHANDDLERTPLHIPAAHGKRKAIVLLVNKGAHINAQNSLGHTPVHKAANEGQLVFGVLSKKGACMYTQNVSGLTPLHLAAARSDVNIVNSLVDQGGRINAKDNEGHTALHDAIARNDVKIFSFLLSKGESLNASDSKGRIAFHRVVSCEARDTLCHFIRQRASGELVERFSKLPTKLQFIAVEQFESKARLRDFLKYEKVQKYKKKCSELAANEMVGVEEAWIHWFKAQAAGVALCFFSSKQKEVKFLIKHIRVLQRLAISIGVVFHNGVVHGYLVKETGNIPVCHETFHCQCYIGTYTSEKNAPRSHLVVQAYGALGPRKRFAADGAMTKETLKRTFGPALQLVRLNKCDLVDRFAAIRLAHGGWVSEFCQCIGNIGSASVCSPCLEYHPSVQDFVLVTQTAKHLWNHVAQFVTGTIDAIDIVTHIRADHIPIFKCET